VGRAVRPRHGRSVHPAKRDHELPRQRARRRADRRRGRPADRAPRCARLHSPDGRRDHARRGGADLNLTIRLARGGLPLGGELKMENAFVALVSFLGSSVAIGGAVLLVLRKWLEVRVTEPIKAEFADRLAAQRREFEREMADRQAALQQHNSEELKRFDILLERQTKDEETAQLIQQLEYPVLHEADRIIRRVAEVMRRIP
jgi:hypothetical protein